MIKKTLKFAGIAFALLIVVFIVLKTVSDRHYFDDYDAKRPFDLQVKSTEDINKTKEVFGIERQQAFRRTEFTFDAREGDRVPCVLTQPLEFTGKLPTIIFVHGSGQRKTFVEEICTPFNKAGFAMVSYDQWNCGDRKLPEGDWRKITAWYDRGWRACNDARRLADYLLTRDDVDPDRLYLVGASYGAMTGTHILAHDKRFKAGVLVVGGGNFNVMLQAPLIKANVPSVVLAILSPVASWLGGPFDPIRSAPDTGPTPILMQNGSADTLVSPDAGRELYAKLAEPKEIVWYDVDHPGLRKTDGPEIIRMLDDGLKWLAVKAHMPVPESSLVTTALPAAAASEAEHPAQ